MTLFSNRTLDKFFAPGISNFDSMEAEDLAEYSSKWLAKHCLNSILRGSYEETIRQFVFNALRRIEAAFTSYGLGRDATLRFLAGTRQAISVYMEAMLHWEQYLNQAWLAITLLTKPGETTVFERGSGAPLERLNALHNRVKHADEHIAKGKFPPDGTLVVWMENSGLRSTCAHLTWQEASQLLKELAQMAAVLEDPLSARSRFHQLFGTGGDEPNK